MKLTEYYIIHADKLDEETKASAISANVLADKAYEAGKLDKELSLKFDNPKGRFLNSEINLVN